MKSPFLYVVALVLLSCQIIQASWTKVGLHSDSTYNKITTSTIDNYNNLIFAGLYEESISFGSLSLNKENTNGFIGKTNTAGELAWIKALITDSVSTSSVTIKQLTTDNSGNIYATGSFKHSITINNTVIKVDNASTNGFILKFDPNGNLIWHKLFTDTLSNYGETIHWSNNKLYVGVRFKIGFYYNDTRIKTSHPLAEDSFISAILCINDNGDLDWSTVINAENSLVIGITGNNDYIYVLCSAKGQPYLDYLNGTSPFYMTYSIGLADNYVISLNKTDGKGNWSNQIGSTGYENGSSIAYYDNSIFCAGQYKNELKCKSQDGNMIKLTAGAKFKAYLVKYSTEGNLQWANNYGNHSTTGIFSLSANSIGLAAALFYKDSISINSNFYHATDGALESILTIFNTGTGKIEQIYNTISHNNKGETPSTYLMNIQPISDRQFLFTGYTKGEFNLSNIKTGDAESTEFTSFLGLLEAPLNIAYAESPKLKIYPNPTKGVIHFSKINEHISTIQIFNTIGTHVATKQLSSGKVNLSFLPRGYYIIKYDTNYIKLLVE